jgi:hypothetical protein
VKLDLRIVGAALATGVALIIVGVIVGRPTVGIEGAFFNSVGGARAAGVFVRTGTGLVDPADGNLWIGAGIAVLLATGALLLLRSWPSHTPSA